MADRFGYSEFGAFNQYAAMNQAGIHGVPPGLGGVDMQQFAPLMANAFGPQLSSTADLLDALAQQQGLGFNAAAFLSDPSQSGGMRGAGQMNHGGNRGGFNRSGVSRSNSNLPNPDGLREDTVFVSNLPQTIDHEDMKSQFGVVGKIKINNKSGMPMIWIFKERGVPKGEALVTYEDPSCVQAAIDWFEDHDFFGHNIEVKQATNSQRPVIIPPGGGGNSQQHQMSNNQQHQQMNSLMNNQNLLSQFASAFNGNQALGGMQDRNVAQAIQTIMAAASGGMQPKNGPNLAALASAQQHQQQMALLEAAGQLQHQSMGYDDDMVSGLDGSLMGQRGGRHGYMRGRGGMMSPNGQGRVQGGRADAMMAGPGGSPSGVRGDGMMPMGRGSMHNVNSPAAMQMAYGRGGGSGGTMAQLPGVSGMGQRGGAIARGVGPMRGSGMGSGRGRPAPY